MATKNEDVKKLETEQVDATPVETVMTAEKETETAPKTGEDAPVSKREAFRGRISKRYPDLNMDDEDAYYDQMGKTMDEYEGYESNTEKLRSSMEKSPAMAEMLLAARDQEDFDPVVWMVKQKGLDLEAVQNDPDYADKLAQAHSDYLAKQAESDAIEKALSENMPKSVENIRNKAEELGLDDAKTEEIVGKMYQVMDDLVHGIISPEVFTLLAKGETRDADVSAARDEGIAEGLNKKVDDKLRTLDANKERIPGAQTPMKTPAPKKRQSNMFLAGDEDEY